jgi:hypothetical protein
MTVILHVHAALVKRGGARCHPLPGSDDPCRILSHPAEYPDQRFPDRMRQAVGEARRETANRGRWWPARASQWCGVARSDRVRHGPQGHEEMVAF